MIFGPPVSPVDFRSMNGVGTSSFRNEASRFRVSRLHAGRVLSNMCREANASFLHLAGGLLLAATLGACVEVPPRPDDDADLAARGLMAEGRFADAAAELRRLAELAQGDAAAHFTLSAARALMAGERREEALASLEAGDWSEASPAQRVERAALRAEILLARGDAERALALLNDSIVHGATPSMAREIRRIRIEAFAATGRSLDEVRERVALAELALDAKAESENQRLIWKALSGLGGAELDAARRPPPSRVGGWIELAILHRTLLFDHAEFARQIQAWKARYPLHPAGPELVPRLLAESLVVSKPPAKIALLLPTQGAFAEAARAIRDGFLAAWYARRDREDHPTIIIRDTNDADIAAVVAGAAEEGAEFMVGPLRKSSVRNVAALGRPAVPMLALNLLGDDAAAAPEENFYQFALAPEGEAREVARRAWKDGHARAALLAPEGEWGTRVASAFSSAWNRLGGHVVETQRYSTSIDEDSQPPDMSAPVVTLLNIDESSERRSELASALGRRIRFEPRRRSDVDFVFMAGFPREARQLRPQFEFHGAGGLPIYSTSHVYTGIPDPEADSDIDDVVFGDMPMVLLPASSDTEALRGQLHSLWPNRLRGHLRLYAFGFDAYDLITGVRFLVAAPASALQGQSGQLRLDGTGRVQRRLTWARFEHGLARSLDPRLMMP